MEQDSLGQIEFGSQQVTISKALETDTRHEQLLVPAELEDLTQFLVANELHIWKLLD
jgi:hypothetical protein